MDWPPPISAVPVNPDVLLLQVVIGICGHGGGGGDGGGRGGGVSAVQSGNVGLATLSAGRRRYGASARWPLRSSMREATTFTRIGNSACALRHKIDFERETLTRCTLLVAEPVCEPVS